MDNEFGYIDNKPFKNCFPDEQIISIIKTDEDGIQFKINDIEKYDAFDYKDRPRELYAIDSSLRPITAFNVKLKRTNYAPISSTILYSDFYVWGYNGNENISHFTKETKISKMEYYHDEVRNIFGNSSYSAKYKFDKKHLLEFVKIDAKKINKKKIGNVLINNNEIFIYLNSNFEYLRSYNNHGEMSIKDKSSIILTFKKSIDLEEAYKLIKLIDSTIHLLILSKKRHKKTNIYDYKRNNYFLIDRRILKANLNKKDNTYLICKRDEIFQSFINILSNLYKLEENSKNAIFPFLEYDIEKTSLEISFLEYYRALEYLEAQKQKMKGKGKNPTFLIKILKEYKEQKEHFFKKQKDEEIEEEIRSLRNYYSHEGYYMEKLPIPTDNPKRYKELDFQWIYNVSKFVKIVSYLELYRLCDIDVKSKDIMYQL